MDFLVRKKISLHMSYTVLDSLPFPRLTIDDPRVAMLIPLALQLTCTAPEMMEYWNAMAGFGLVEPCPVDASLPGFSSEDVRLEARARIEVIVACDIFQLSRNEIEYILDTFPIVRRKDEAAHGEYRTKRVILEVYDAVQRAMETGELYRTLLDPPPADPQVAHPPRDG